MDKFAFYYIDKSESEIEITLQDAEKDPLPILWFNQGLYGMIPIELVRNIIDTLKTTRNIQGSLSVLNEKSVPSVKIIWDQVVPIPHTVGKMLTGK